MRALIVDDEPLARRGVSLRLRKFPEIVVVGECDNGSKAIRMIVETKPDLIFLDIQMPDIDGFDVLNALPRELVPAVIFLTAHDQHAIRAFEVHAFDYVLKPINNARFSDAVNRALRSAESATGAKALESLPVLPNECKKRFISRFTVHTGSRIRIVNADEVDWIATARDYVELHVGGQSLLIRETMTAMEQRLDPVKFMRIHRCRIVRIAMIVELRSIDNREYLIRLKDGTEHKSSRTYATQLASWLRRDGLDL